MLLVLYGMSSCDQCVRLTAPDVVRGLSLKLANRYICIVPCVSAIDIVATISAFRDQIFGTVQFLVGENSSLSC